MVYRRSGRRGRQGCSRQDGPPTVELRDEYGVLHRMWKVSDPATVAAAQGEDGRQEAHHRRRPSSLRDGAELSATRCGSRRSGNDPEAPYERVMMTFVNMDAPGLVILPTHRVVFGPGKLQHLRQDGAGDAVLRRGRSSATECPDRPRTRPMRAACATRAETRTALLAVTAQNAFLLRARARRAIAQLARTSPSSSASLDVVQLHKLLLEEIIGMSEEDIRAQKHLKYIRDAAEAVNEVRIGRSADRVPDESGAHGAGARHRLRRRGACRRSPPTSIPRC